MSYVLDEGLALFAGLNVIPKRAFHTEYSCRVDPRSYPGLMRRWFDAMASLGLEQGTSFDLDFHTIPFHGENALIEKHYVSKRSRKQKGDPGFCGSRRIDPGLLLWQCRCDEKTTKTTRSSTSSIIGKNEPVICYRQELIFDSKLTTYSEPE